MGVLACAALAGCGGGARQDKSEPSGTWTVKVLKATFPSQQRLAQSSRLVVAVRNASKKPVPNVAVTIESSNSGPANAGGGSTPAAAFAEASDEQGLADPSRPVWVLDDGPRGGVTAYTNTWALGRLPAGMTKTFVWRVTAVKAGVHTIHYKVAAGLNGKARARLAGGAIPEGTFTVHVSGQPAKASVAPNGAVVKTTPGG